MKRAALLLSLLLSLLLALGLCTLAPAQDDNTTDQGSDAAQVESDQAAPADDTTFETEVETSPETEAEAPEIVTIPAKSIAELAQAISTRLGENGTLPEWGRITLASGERPRLSIADIFVLLLQAAQGWYTNGVIPAQISIAIGATDPPILDPQDYPDPNYNADKGRELSADLFLSFASETLRWTERYHQIPTAVWVGGERLSAAEYLSGIAICLEYAYYNGALEETLFLPDYSPPLSWREHTELIVESSDAYQEGETGEESAEATEATGMVPPLLDTSTTAPRVAKPQLTVFPTTGSKVTGQVDLVVSYSGPPITFVTFSIDGKTRAIMNTTPYGYRWNTAVLEPGTHQVIVRAFAEGSVEITAATLTYIITAPPVTPVAKPVAPGAKPTTPDSTPVKATAPPARKS